MTGRKVYSTAEWDRVRRKRLFIAKYRCERCHQRKPLQVHHRTPISHGGAPYDIANLEAVCRDCHQDEHRIEHAPQRGGGKEWSSYLSEKLNAKFAEKASSDMDSPAETSGSVKPA